MSIQLAQTLARQVITEMGITAGEEEVKRLGYYGLLLQNALSRLRITGERELERIIGKQICDSLYLLRFVTFRAGEKVVDVGSGGGLPGIPLKIICSFLPLALVDSNRKKVAFLREIIDLLKLEDTHALWVRAEEIGQDQREREKYCIVTSRAVAVLHTLVEYTLPLVSLGGRALYYKGPQGEIELKNATKAIAILGADIENCWHYELPGGEERTIIALRKVRPTPCQYPRRIGKPSQKPIS